MKKLTRWSPDTCGCVIDYEWDDTQAEDVRVHTAVRTVKRCLAHQADTDVALHYSKALEENQRKNKALQKLLESCPKSMKRETKIVGSNVPGEDFITPPVWRFNENRDLEIDLPEVDLVTKEKLKTDLAEFGTKVKLN